MRPDYRSWLVSRKYADSSIGSRLSDARRVETHYGSLDEQYAKDRLESLLATLRYSTDDERKGRPNPSTIAIDGNVRNSLASYRGAVELYRQFLEEVGNVTTPEAPASRPSPDDDRAPRFALERDMQAALRREIAQLGEDLEIIDGGTERSVESGRIDITARDPDGTIVVIELKAGQADHGAVGQILGYMGDVAMEEGSPVRGLLVAADFNAKARSAARMVPTLRLFSYGIKFQFGEVV